MNSIDSYNYQLQYALNVENLSRILSLLSIECPYNPSNIASVQSVPTSFVTTLNSLTVTYANNPQKLALSNAAIAINTYISTL